MAVKGEVVGKGRRNSHRLYLNSGGGRGEHYVATVQGRGEEDGKPVDGKAISGTGWKDVRSER